MTQWQATQRLRLRDRREHLIQHGTSTSCIPTKLSALLSQCFTSKRPTTNSITCEILIFEIPHVIPDSPPRKNTCKISISANPHVISDTPSRKFTCEIAIFENPHVIADSSPKKITCEIAVFENPHVIPDSPPKKITCVKVD